MFQEYYQAPPDVEMEYASMTVADHTALLGALVTGPQGKQEFMEENNLRPRELNKCTKIYKQVERYVQRQVANTPTLTKTAMQSDVAAEFSITLGLAGAILDAMEVRNTRGDTWADLRAAIVDTIDPEDDQGEDEQ